jgi:hypothetical protein
MQSKTFLMSLSESALIRVNLRPILLAVFFLLTAHCSLLTAQTAARYEISGSGAPTGSCTVTGSGYSQTYVDRVTGNHYNCVGTAGTTSGTWTLNGNVNAGAGTVTTSGSPASPQLAKFSSSTAITTATATDVSTPVFCSDAGASDTYACSLAPAPVAYVVGTHLRFKANTANTGAASINFNTLGALTIVKVAGGITTALADNDIRAGQWVDGVVATGSNFQIQSTLGNASGASPAGSDGDLQMKSGSGFAASSANDAGPSSTAGLTITKTSALNSALDRAIKISLIKANSTGGAAAEIWNTLTGTTPPGDVYTMTLGMTNNSTENVNHGTVLLINGVDGTGGITSNIGLRIYPGNNALNDNLGVLIGHPGAGAGEAIQSLAGTISFAADGAQDLFRSGGIGNQGPFVFYRNHNSFDGRPVLGFEAGQPEGHQFFTGNATKPPVSNGSIYIQDDATTNESVWFKRKGAWAKSNGSELVNAQTGTTYTISDADGFGLNTFSNASAIAITLPQAGTLNGTFSDNFNRADGALGANWTTLGTNALATVESNSWSTNYSTQASRLSANFLPNQTVQAKLLSNGSFPYRSFVVVRANSEASASFYRCGQNIDDANVYVIDKSYNGSLSRIATSAVTAVANDVVNLTISGNGPITLNCSVNGSVIPGLGPVIDTSGAYVLSGTPGLMGTAGFPQGPMFDDFVATGTAAGGQSFINGWAGDFQNDGAGPAVITPTTSTIAGKLNLTLTTGQKAHVTSDGANYKASVTNTAAAQTFNGANTAASTAISNTTTETYFNLNYQIPANALSAGKSIKLDARGVYSALGTDSLVLKVKLCTVSGCGSGTVVTLATAGAITPGALSNQGWLLNMNGVQYTAGASGTQDDQGYVSYQTAANAVTFAPMSNTAANTVDTTVAQFLSISATWAGVGAPSASDTITLRNLIVEVK